MASKQIKYHFFAFISRMKFINRWGLMRNTQPENIQEHSLQVAVISHALAIIKNKLYNGNIDANKVAVIGMYHDSNETITGDMPTPIKYFSKDIMDAYKSIEDISKTKLLSMLPIEIRDEYQQIFHAEENQKDEWELVKAADRIAAYLKCLEEDKAGNKEFKKAGSTILKSINEIELLEVKYFMANFVPSFSLTLDELE